MSRPWFETALAGDSEDLSVGGPAQPRVEFPKFLVSVTSKLVTRGSDRLPDPPFWLPSTGR
jgi:hypothetical protein